MRQFIVVDQSLIKPGGHYFEYSLAVAEGAVTQGFAAHILANRQFNPEVRQACGEEPGGIVITPWFTNGWDRGTDISADGFGPGHLGYELRLGLAQLQAGPDDIALVHTLGWHQVSQLLASLCRLPPWRLCALPALAILLRYEPRELDGPTVSSLRTAFARLAARPGARERIQFHTDTDRLTALAAELFGVPFTTLPIPFDQRHLRQGLQDRRPDRPLTLLYAGDARDEKGYPLLPGLAAALWDDHLRPGRVRLVAQSNFNVAGGEPGSASARMRMEQYPAPAVKLLTRPQDSATYFRQIADADIVLIPYDPQRYNARSSGILVEALAAGKVVVTTRGSWMEDQVSPDAGVVFDYPEGFVAAVRQALTDYPALSAAARRDGGAWSRRSDPARFVAAIAHGSPPTSSATPSGPEVLFVMDGDAMVLRNGASRVALNQLGVLFAAGYSVTGLFLSMEPTRRGEALYRFRDALERELNRFPFRDVFLAGFGPEPMAEDAEILCGQGQRAGSYSILQDINYRYCIQLPTELVLRLHRRPPALVILNYVTNLPVIRRLGLEGVPILCEMHDIQTFQKAIYGGRSVDPGDLLMELRLLAGCSHLVSLSALEADHVRLRLPGVPVTHLPFMVDPDPTGYEDFSGARSLVEVLLQAGCERMREEDEADFAERLAGVRSLDIVFVSSRHQPNADGLRWFFDEVYAPYLADADVTVFLAGTICELPGWPENDRVFRCGRVENLRPLYAAAKLVILPIRDGAGSAVKTLEALALGKPVVATPHAMRGLGEAAVATLGATDRPEAFAHRILNLLGHAPTRMQAARQSIAVAQSFISPAEYRERFLGIVAGLAGAPPSDPGEADWPVERRDGRTAMPVGEAWSAEVACLNACLAFFLAGDGVDLATLEQAALLLQDEPGDSRALLDRLCRSHPARSPQTDPAELCEALPQLIRLAATPVRWRSADGTDLDHALGRFGLDADGVATAAVLVPSTGTVGLEVSVTGSAGGGLALAVDGVNLRPFGRTSLGIADSVCWNLPAPLEATMQPCLRAVHIRLATSSPLTVEDIRISLTGLDGAALRRLQAAIPSVDPGLVLHARDAAGLAGPPGGAIRMGDLSLLISSRETRGAGAAMDFRAGNGFPALGAWYSPKALRTGGLGHPETWTDCTWDISASLLNAPLLSSPQAVRQAFDDGTLGLEGHVDIVTERGTVEGWVYCPQAPRLRLTVVAERAGVGLDRAMAIGFRPDVRSAGKGDGRFHFSLNLAGYRVADTLDDIAIKVVEADRVIGKAVLPSNCIAVTTIKG